MRKEDNKKPEFEEIKPKFEDDPQKYNQFGFFKVEFDPEYDAANGKTWDCDTNDLH